MKKNISSISHIIAQSITDTKYNRTSVHKKTVIVWIQKKYGVSIRNLANDIEALRFRLFAEVLISIERLSPIDYTITRADEKPTGTLQRRKVDGKIIVSREVRNLYKVGEVLYVSHFKVREDFRTNTECGTFIHNEF